jgi:general secretion pathway protein G
MTIRPVATQALRNARHGFTLLEVLVVVSIIVMLAGIGGYMLFQRYEEANIRAAKAKAQGVADAVFTYRLNNKTMPNSVEDLLTPQGDNATALLPREAIYDPWGKPYSFSLGEDGMTIVAMTTGPRGQIIKAER